METNMEVSKFMVCPYRPPPSLPPTQNTAARQKKQRKVSCSELSREQTLRLLLPPGALAEVLANHGPASLKGSWT